MKFYTWKEIYDKTLEAPFIPKSGDNFDSKYCNAPDKIGLDTKEKYENYLRNESFKNAFRGFTNNQLDSEEEEMKNAKESKNQNKKPNENAFIINTREAIKNIKLSNPHINISNISMSTMNHNKDCSFSYSNNNFENKNNMSCSNIENKYSNLSGIENKFLKMKKQAASSSSTSSLLRQYKMSNISNNSTSTSINYMHRRNGSSMNFQQK